MSQPTPENIQVSLKELRRESKMWEDISNGLKPVFMYAEVQGDLNHLQMGIFFPATEAYNTACSAISRISRSGADEAKKISDLLANIANVYEREEQVNTESAQSIPSIHAQYGKW